MKTFVIRPLPHAATVLSLLGLAASNEDGGRDVEPVPVSWRPGEKRGQAPDLREEVQSILRANRNFPAMWRHRFTGQVRVFDMIEPNDRGVRIVQFQRGGRMLAHADGSAKVLRRSFSDALQWLRNAEEVTS